MQRSVTCKFYAQGACLKGDFCQFSHDLSIALPKNECRYYQRGTCNYGARCRFEHPKTASSSSAAGLPMTSNDAPLCLSSCDSAIEMKKNPSVANNPIVPRDSAINSTENPSNPPVLLDLSIGNIPTVETDIPSEPCAENGGNDRMDMCATREKYCLHPSKPEEREKHAIECEKQALEHSQQIECSICLEHVLSKTLACERKFGLLSECDHAFCISCIKIWRRSSSDSGVQVNSAARACPVCRKVSYYVIPSPIWSSSMEEKQDIINKYKEKLKSVDCRYFRFGNGHCRRGTRCFYKHEVKAGSSKQKSTSKGKKKCINSQNRATWEDVHLELDAMLEDFEDLFINEEATRELGVEAPESLTELYKRLEELGIFHSHLESDYDPDFEYDPHGGAIRLEPWQRQYFYEQTGFYDFDDFTDYRNFDDSFGPGAGDFGSDDE